VTTRRVRTDADKPALVFAPHVETASGMILPDALAMMGSLDLVIPDIDR
jgi:NADH:ubiquinone oxidoreductase subunit D